MPSRAQVTADQEPLLRGLEALAEQRTQIEAAYIEAILGCLEAGITKAEIGRAAGISGEAVRQLERRRTT